MKQVTLYPVVPRVRRTFEGVQRVTLPNQCMSLAEMFRRFVRREPLPVEKKGVYIEGEHDLEKLAQLDRVEQDELLDQLKADTASKEKRAKEKAKEELAKQEKQREAIRLYEESQKQAAQTPPTGSKGPEGKAA